MRLKRPAPNGGDMNAQRPNIVLIMTDQMRADCLGVENHPVVETPNVDELAAKGVRFTSAYSAVPSCIAARAALFTGMTQKNHGRVGYRDGVVWDYGRTLAGELSAAGYQTQAVGKMHVSPTRNMLGFHNVILHDGYMHYNRNFRKPYAQYDDYSVWLGRRFGHDHSYDFTASGLNCNSWCARPWHLAEEAHPTTWVGTESVDFLRRRDPQKPFFLFMSFVRPHAPLDPPPAYFDMYRDREMPDPPIGDWARTNFENGESLRIDTGEGRIGRAALRRARAAYYACITHIDAQINRLRQALFEYELRDNTFFVFISDHGEMLGDHNLFRKELPYDGSARIPFIVTPPPGWNSMRNRALAQVVELRDVMPTILDAANVAIPPSVEGTSVLPLVRGENPLWREYLHGEHSGSNSNHYVTDGKTMYVWFSQTGREQLFDLASDPQNRIDLAGEASMKDVLEKFRRRLICELKGREEGYSDGEKLIVGRAPKAILAHLERCVEKRHA